MSSYLLTWNPKNWPEEKFDEFFLQYEKDETLRWSCGTTKKIIAGDYFYLLKQGKGSTGIIGSGMIVSEPYYASHYEEEKAKLGDKALFVDIKFDYLAHPRASIPILRGELNGTGLASTIWSTQGSGKTIPEEIEVNLKKLWQSRANLKEFVYPEEVADSSIVEGAKSKVTVNSYERSAEARRKCLDKWGYNCSVCNFHFELFYGSIGKKYIHVHHLVPLSSIGEEYKLDPINDLRPVCPNCHAMLHKNTPPLSIGELRKLVRNYGCKTG